MGGCLNIEIHLRLNSNAEFISELYRMLEIGMDENQLTKFLRSIKLHDEGEHKWYDYLRTQFKFNQDQNIKSMNWDIYLYNLNDKYKYVLELSLPESDVQIYDDDWPYFDNEKTNEIIKIMNHIHKLNNEAVILFTDEASQGVFMKNLNKANNDINYLFDLALLTPNLKWDNSKDKYEKLKILTNGELWKSRSKYMRKFKESIH